MNIREAKQQIKNAMIDVYKRKPQRCHLRLALLQRFLPSKDTVLMGAATDTQAVGESELAIQQ